MVSHRYKLAAVLESVDWRRACRLAATSASSASSPSTVSQKPFYITTPIFYVNAGITLFHTSSVHMRVIEPHIGHLYTMVLTDVLRRWHAFRHHRCPTYFTTGTDEHGLKVQQAAMSASVDPIRFCDDVSMRFEKLASAADVVHDKFVRTTTPEHKLAVSTLWSRLESNGYIYKGRHEGWYAVADEAFHIQTRPGVDPLTGEACQVAVETGSRVELAAEETYRFRLGRLREPILDWLRSSPSVIQPQERLNEALAFIESQPELPDLSISRPVSRLTWGVPVPNDPSQTIYVWVDALTSYLSATGFPGDTNGAWPPDVHVIGKDILRFHAIYHPAFLLAAGIPLPRRLLVHAHWTAADGRKMSKSRQNAVNPYDVLNHRGWCVDAARFWLCRFGGLTHDRPWDWRVVDDSYAKVLAGQLGNLVGRLTSVKVNPELRMYATSDVCVKPSRDAILIDGISEAKERISEAFEDGRVGRALELTIDAIADINRYVTATSPWKITESMERRSVLHVASDATRVLGLLLQPVMPTKSSELLGRLGVAEQSRGWAHAAMGAGWQTANEGSIELVKGVLFPALVKSEVQLNI